MQDTCEDAFSKTGEVVGITSCETYKSCSNKRCYKKKTVNNICPSCSKESQCDITSVVCSVVINQDDDFKELTLFTPQVEELIQKPISPETKEIEESILSCIPIHIKFIESPKKDNTISKLKRQ